MSNHSSSESTITGTAADAPQFGVVFDIDGVLLRGHSEVARSADALSLLTSTSSCSTAAAGSAGIEPTTAASAEQAAASRSSDQHSHASNWAVPLLFVSNASGYTEEKKARLLRSHFGEKVGDDQVVLASSPLQQVSSLREKRLLLVAHRIDEANTVAHKYGWQNVVHLEDFYREHSYLWPLGDGDGQQQRQEQKKLADEPSSAFPTSTAVHKIEAVVIIHCPTTGWGEAIQVVSDVLQSDGTLGCWVDEQCIPLYVTNYDLVYTTEYSKPRFTTGAFIRCLEMLHSSLTARKLQIQRFGKPFASTYQYAENVLSEQLRAGWGEHAGPLRRIYAIGDNPLSDIKGANERGDPWRSILVRTGCHTDEQNDKLFPADHFCEDAYAAVRYILEQEAVLSRCSTLAQD
mmetsp:Transcript_39733/g.100101  ORF Transcript_39733/g.100101 Transcript_39733/m.100101 type:complete len:404 (-) Transcript_39733:58-1269(-)